MSIAKAQRFVGCMFGLLMAACGSENRSGNNLLTDASTKNDSNNVLTDGAPNPQPDSQFNFPDSVNPGPNPSTDCPPEAQLVYVLTDTNELYTFDPPNKVFKKIGKLSCPTSMQPNSMAISRDTFAYVNYVQSNLVSDTAGSIFKLDLKTKECVPTSVKLTSGWYRLGMGFSSNTTDGTSETLFVASTSSTSSIGLASVDLNEGKLNPIGPFTNGLSGQSAELTGTGDAKLYGFFTTSPVKVAEINKDSAATPTAKSLSGVSTPSAWAFSFWGGSFYLYVAPASGNSKVVRFDPVTGTIETSYVANTGMRIVGAGVSTCAPYKPPK